jgi:hypothetical protein
MGRRISDHPTGTPDTATVATHNSEMSKRDAAALSEHLSHLRQAVPGSPLLHCSLARVLCRKVGPL